VSGAASSLPSPSPNGLPSAGDDGMVRHDWAVEEVEALYRLPLLELLGRAQAVHRAHFPPAHLERTKLLSIKTGGCPEDCAYCPQSAHYAPGRAPGRLMALEAVREAARQAKAEGAQRFCMGAAWRSVREGPEFDAVLAMVREVKALGLETCATLGMLTPAQAARLAEAGLDYYNHNLDTGADFYPRIITTRRYEDRLATLAAARAAGLRLCCGGIVGLGESVRDRAALLATLARFSPHPESVPINGLVAVPATPLGERPPPDPLELVRMVATARLVLPRSVIRLAAGRVALSREAQILCLLAGANSLFIGERLLTTPNAGEGADAALFAALAPFAGEEARAAG
jgi:biotin synthase